MNAMPRYNPALHRIAQITAAATLLLIFMGGLVTSHGVGMSVPDWPNTYGDNMFTFPPSQWIGGIFYEHTHRLMGTVVGFCSVLLVLNVWAPGTKPAVRKLLWIAAAIAAGLMLLFAAVAAVTSATNESEMLVQRVITQMTVGFAGSGLVLVCAAWSRQPESRRWVRWLAVGVLAAVVFQGLLGGLRVVLVNLDLAVVHACVAQAFFCLTALFAVVTSRWWIESPIPQYSPAAKPILALATACVIAIYLQLVVGALMRHYQAGLAIPDFPLSYGQLLPPTNADSLNAANQMRLAEPSLRGKAEMQVTLYQIWLHFGHRIGAAAVSVLLIALVIVIVRRRLPTAVRRPALLLAMLLIAQLTLGILTVLLRKPADIASLHVAVGALTLVTTFVLLIRAMRLYSPLGRATRRDFGFGAKNSTLVPA